MRFAVYGAGGVGGYFGGRLAQAGEEVAFIARGAHRKALEDHGLKVESIKGDFAVPRVTVTDDPSRVGPVDVLIVAVKTWQLRDILPSLVHLVHAETMILPLLNGVEAADEIAVVAGRERVLKGMAWIISNIREPGVILHVGAEPRIVLGEMDGARTDRVDRLRLTLEACGVVAEIPDDIDVALWKKFLFVVSVGGMGAVTRAPIGVIRKVPETRQLLADAMAEIRDVGLAGGIALPPEVVETSLAFADTLPPQGKASLQRDIAEGRRSELEAWNGAVVRLGKARGVETPVHRAIYNSLLPLELRARGELSFE